MWILSLSQLNSSVLLFHDRTWNTTIFTNHNQLIMSQEKLRKNRRHSISILSHMKKILLDFQWNPPSKTQKPADQTWKTTSYEISFWALRRVSVVIVTYYLWTKQIHLYRTSHTGAMWYRMLLFHGNISLSNTTCGLFGDKLPLINVIFAVNWSTSCNLAYFSKFDWD